MHPLTINHGYYNSCEQDCTTLTYYQILLVQNITPHTSYMLYKKRVIFEMVLKTHTKTITNPPLLCTVFFRLQNTLVYTKRMPICQVTNSSFHNLRTWKNTILITEIKAMLWEQSKSFLHTVLHCLSEGKIYDIYLTILVALMYTLSFKWQFPSWGITIPANLLSRARWEVWSVITRSSRFASLRHPIWLYKENKIRHKKAVATYFPK